MKNIKSLLTTFALIATILVLASPTQAQGKSDPATRVRGNIYGATAGLEGLTVTVVCNGNTDTATTNNNGLYQVVFPAGLCPVGTGVSASVTYEGQNQSQTVFVSASNTATLDFYYGAAVPELGAVTGVVAAIGSAVTYMGIRKKLS